jgi:transcriptional regulator with XRE-family HTH domain
MTGATLKTIREALGLPVAWLARAAGVQERSVRYWESGRVTVPADVAAMIQRLESAAETMEAQSVAQIRATIAEYGTPVEPVLLVRYQDDDDLARYQPEMAGLPVTFHAAVLARVRRAMASDGVEVIMRTLDAPAYEAWRRGTQQEDSAALRAQYVSM